MCSGGGADPAADGQFVRRDMMTVLSVRSIWHLASRAAVGPRLSDARLCRRTEVLF